MNPYNEIRSIAARLENEIKWLSEFANDPKRPAKGGEAIGRQKGTHSDPTASTATDAYRVKVKKQYKRVITEVDKALGALRKAEAITNILVGGNEEPNDVEWPGHDLSKAELRKAYDRQQQREARGGGFGAS